MFGEGEANLGDDMQQDFPHRSIINLLRIAYFCLLHGSGSEIPVSLPYVA